MAEIHTGAMVALLPASTDASRLAVPGGEEPQQLHCTLLYLGEAADLDEDDRTRVVVTARALAEMHAPLTAEAFAVDVFNPNTDDSCIVLGVGGDPLEFVHDHITANIGDMYPQRKPWIAHVTLAYTEGMTTSEQFDYASEFTDRLGPVTFDRIRVAFGGEYMDFPLHTDGVTIEPITAAVNTSGWQKLPIADRETKFAFRAAIDRLAAKAQSIEQFSSWFFWRDPSKPANNRNSYRMPFADVFDDGVVRLVPSAVFSAAAQLAGAHGALPIIPEREKEQIRATITRIYDEFRTMWDDPRQVPPWDRPSTEEEGDLAVGTTAAVLGEEEEVDEIVAAVNTAGWSSYPIADRGREWDSGAANQRLQSWADGDMAKFRKAHLWWDAANAENVTAYKFPIADVINGELTIIPRAVNNAKARLSQADIPASDKAKILGILNRIQKRFAGDESEESESEESETAAVTAGIAPVRAPKAWFDDPKLPGPTKLRVEDSGRVYGHLAQWGTCHRGIGSSCVVAPRSTTGYAHFRTGTTMTEEGALIAVGSLTYGSGHADTSLGLRAAAAHYDNAATAVAQVNVGEDAHGIWVAGAMAAGTGEVEAQQLRAHPLSGDWRAAGGNLELIAALAVNTPGFPIAEPQLSLSASGAPVSLLAAGVVEDETCGCSSTAAAGADDARMADRVAAIEQKAQQLMERVNTRRARTIIDVQLPTRR